MITMKIDTDKIREVIGSGGKVIQKILADSGAKIDIEDDGYHLHLRSADTESLATRQEGHRDHRLRARGGRAVLRQGGPHLMQFGAFVELAPGKDGLVHISKLANHRVDKVEDVVNDRRHDLGQGHRHRREGPRQPEPQGRSPGDPGAAGPAAGSEVSKIPNIR